MDGRRCRIWVRDSRRRELESGRRSRIGLEHFCAPPWKGGVGGGSTSPCSNRWNSRGPTHPRPLPSWEGSSVPFGVGGGIARGCRSGGGAGHGRNLQGMGRVSRCEPGTVLRDRATGNGGGACFRVCQRRDVAEARFARVLVCAAQSGTGSVGGGDADHRRTAICAGGERAGCLGWGCAERSRDRRGDAVGTEHERGGGRRRGGAVRGCLCAAGCGDCDRRGCAGV